MNEAKIQKIEKDIEQLRRALTNPNMPASQQGAPQNTAALERIERKQKEIEELRSEKRE